MNENSTSIIGGIILAVSATPWSDLGWVLICGIIGGFGGYLGKWLISHVRKKISQKWAKK